MSEQVVVSHSEVESFLSCESKHYFAFGDPIYGPGVGLEPKGLSDSLFRGITGHEALSVFFKSIQQGNDVATAEDETKRWLTSYVAMRPEIFNYPSHVNIVTDLAVRILPRYFNHEVVQALDKGWFPVHVEETFYLRMDIGGREVVYPFKPDVIMRDAAGNLWVWDHKFVYNFYSGDEIELLPQIPKYIGALRALGIPVKGGYYNMLRWREVKTENDHVRGVPFVPTDVRVQNAFRQQYNVMMKIAELKSGPVEDWNEQRTRVLSTMVCKSCSFKLLCSTELNGLDTTLMKRVNFNPNSYGYKPDE